MLYALGVGVLRGADGHNPMLPRLSIVFHVKIDLAVGVAH